MTRFSNYKVKFYQNFFGKFYQKIDQEVNNYLCTWHSDASTAADTQVLFIMPNAKRRNSAKLVSVLVIEKISYFRDKLKTVEI